MRTLLSDVGWALRSLRAAGSTTAFAVVTLAIGIGCTTAIFSIVNAVLLRPLPYRDTDRLVAVWQHVRPLGLTRVPLSLPELRDYAEQSRTIEGIAGLQSRRVTRQADYPELWETAQVSANLLTVLGVDVRIGRNFGVEENEPGRTHIVILTDALWRRSFGGDSAAIGRTLILDGTPYTVVGVLPPGVRVPGLPHADLLVPATYGAEDLARRNTRNFQAIARLAAEVPRERAQEEFQSIASRGATIAGLSTDLIPLRTEIVGAVERPLVLTLAAVGFVLVIACVNVANLSLSRLTVRGRELAVRSALGASRMMLIRQLMTECVLLAIVAGAAGLALAYGVQDILVRLSPGDFPRLDDMRIDGRVVWFTVALSALAGVALGIISAWQPSGANVIDALKEDGASAGSVRRRGLRQLLVASEVGLALVLLICAGLVVRSFLKLLSEQAGFDHTRVVTAAVDLSESRYPDRQQRTQFFASLLEGVRSQPGVEFAAITSALPMTGTNADFGFVIPGRPLPSERDFFSADWRVVSDDYFRALSIPLRRGRYLGAGDRADAPPVVVINEAMARSFWPTDDPIGHQIKLGQRSSPLPTFTIVGVVGNVRHAGLHQAPRSEMYVAHGQAPEMRSVFRFPPMTLVARYQPGVDPASVVRGMRVSVRDLDPQQALGTTSTMEALLSTSLASRRFSVRLCVVFAGLALIMAAIGVYGVVSSWVQLRVREIGIRMALGAGRRDVVRLIVGEGMRLSGAGAALGLLAALGMTRVLRTLLYETSTSDPLTFAVAPLVTMTVALGACWAPAWQAATVDPLAALRLDLRTFPTQMRRRAAGLLRTRLSGAIDRALNRSPIEFTRLTAAMAASARTARSLEEHAAQVAETIRAELRIECLTIFVRDERSGSYVAMARQPAFADDNQLTLSADAFVIRRLRGLSTTLATSEAELETWVDAIADAPPDVRQERRHECATLRTSGSAWLFPLRVKNELVGILGLGPRSDQAPLSSDDRMLLSSLAAQVAFVVQNTQLALRVAEQDRLRREMEIAASVQRRLFPQQPPRVPGYAIVGVCHPAREVGGDYFDYFTCADAHVVLAVADVAGKGLGSALVMSSVQAALRTLSVTERSPARIAAQINRLLYDTTEGNSYATLFCGRLDPGTTRLSYVNAGHCPPLICRSKVHDGLERLELRTGGPVVGLLPDCVYEDGVVDLHEGDVLVIYTDGVSEAMNNRGEEFGEDRLFSVVAASSWDDVNALTTALLERVEAWRGATPQLDDQTLVVARVADAIEKL
jgi:putative ABC transport system permease protein